MALIVFTFIGVFIGVLSSLFGLGGGFVVVPILYVFLPHVVPAEYVMHTAVGTSLAVMIINSTNSTYNHSKQGNINWMVFRQLAGFIASGALIGGLLARYIDGGLLKCAFIMLLCYVIISNLYKKTANSNDEFPISPLPGRMSRFVIGSFIGIISTLLGIGGSVMTIPYLRKYGMRMLHAVALATPLGLPVAIVGASTYLASGLRVAGMPDSTIGFIYIPALIGFSLGGLIGVPIGRRWAQKIPDTLFFRIYLWLLIIVVITMIIE
ncbi:sulfite exporter TauE/SafE family protein [Paenibacillus sp. FSL W8-0187]|uniref:sulfite exporter TauE/SafE family protein n=1 Tax=unclassified Paenibacillus TaxID=185978 RepID=UPI0030D94175